MRRLTRTLALALLAASLLAPSAARADSDPASDTLLLQDTFFPVQPPLPTPYSNAIRNLAVTMKKAGYPIKVAIIATPNDLGLVPQLFNKPASYAPYLGREIAFNAKKPLLIVMPAGYGVNNVTQPVATAVQALKPPGSSLTSIGNGTIDAMVTMSKAAGHPVAKPSVSGGGSGSTSPAIIFGVPVLVLALAGGLAALKRRDRAQPSETPAP